MFNNPLVRCALRLFTLAIMVGFLGFLVATEKVAAGQSVEVCERQQAFCLLANCSGLSGINYELCRQSCDLTYESCRWNDDFQPNPAPFPVEDERRATCMLGAQGCWDLEEPADILFCSAEIQDYCYATYPRP